jgi:serine acetyltransferase
MSAELASHQLIARDVKLGRDAVPVPLCWAESVPPDVTVAGNPARILTMPMVGIPSRKDAH